MNDVPTTFCWSDNEERFTGAHPTREEALAAGTEIVLDDEGRTVWTGRCVPVAELLTRHPNVIRNAIDRLVEDVDLNIGEAVGAEDEMISLTPEHAAKLAGIVQAFLVEHVSDGGWFSVDDVQQHEVTP